jgi:hypothetical protein
MVPLSVDRLSCPDAGRLAIARRAMEAKRLAQTLPFVMKLPLTVI